MCGDNNMTLSEFVNKYTEIGVDYDHDSFSNHFQCVDLYRQYVKEVLGYPQSPGVTGAKDIWDSYLKEYFEQIKNTPTGVPNYGDIIIWGSTYGTYGHVAVCISGNTSSFVAFSQNDPAGSLCVLKEYKSYRGVLGWLHPQKAVMNPDEIAVKKTDFENLVKKATSLDEILNKYMIADQQALYNMVGGLNSRITDLTNQLGTAQAEQKNKEEIISTKDLEIAKCHDDIVLLTDRLDLSNNTVAQLGKDKGTLAIEVEQLKIQVETLKQLSQQGKVTLSIGDLFKLLWSHKITIER